MGKGLIGPTKVRLTQDICSFSSQALNYKGGGGFNFDQTQGLAVGVDRYLFNSTNR